MEARPLNLKLYGLPRTYTNWVALNVMKNFPTIRVWHNNGPEEPTGEKYWKHGTLKEVPGVDGYILVSKPFGAWEESMKKYMKIGPIKIDERFLRFVYDGWMKDTMNFSVYLSHSKSKCFWYNVDDHDLVFAKDGPTRLMRTLLQRIAQEFEIDPPDSYFIETRRLRRNGDATPLDAYCLPQTDKHHEQEEE